MGRERWRAFEREREVRKEKPAAFLSGFCHGLAAEIQNITTPSIPDYWANIYFKTNFNH
jgi:hypothetical protein